MKLSRKPTLSIVHKPTWRESHGIASHADYRPQDFAYQREMNRRDGSTFEPSPPAFQRNLIGLYRDARLIAALLIKHWRGDCADVVS